MLPYAVLELRYYLAGDGQSPFEQWFSSLDAAAGRRWLSPWRGSNRATSQTSKG
jgi:hypothetical protein